MFKLANAGGICIFYPESPGKNEGNTKGKFLSWIPVNTFAVGFN